MKKITLLFYLLFLGINQTSQSMHLGARTLAKKVFPGFMTGLHWSIAAGYPITTGLFGLYLNHNEKNIDLVKDPNSLYTPNETVKNFINTELNKRDVEAKDIKVDSGIHRNMEALFGTLFISEDIYQEMNEAIVNNKIRKPHIGVLNHESNHLRYKDTLKTAIACLVTPFLTHTSFKAINDLIVPPSMKINSFRVKQCIKIPSAIGKLIINGGGVMAFKRYTEQRADDQIVDDIEILESLRTDFLKPYAEEELKIMEDNKANMSPVKFTLHRLRNLYMTDHPSTAHRIKILDQRIERLKSQNPISKT